MRKFVRNLLLLLSAIAATAMLEAQNATPQASDLRVYVAPLQGEDADLAKTVTEKLIGFLKKRGVSVSESREEADAVLSGSGLIQSTFGTSFSRRPSYRIRAIMRLVNKRGVILWAADVSSSRYAVSESSSFADKAAKSVSDALSEESKRKNSEPALQRVKQVE